MSDVPLLLIFGEPPLKYFIFGVIYMLFFLLSRLKKSTPATNFTQERYEKKNMSEFLFGHADMEELRVCPYGNNHTALDKNMGDHLLKCRAVS
jgi:hypothetical protein